MFDWGRTRKVILVLLIAALLFESGVKYERYRHGREAESIRLVEGDNTVPDQKSQADGPEPAGTSEDAETAEFVFVHVVGAVKNPGVFRIRLPARVIDAVNQAVPDKDADLSRLNLAEPILDGQQIHVPRRGEDLQAGAGGPPGSSAAQRSDGKININTATAGELDVALPGVGPVLAERIVDYRKTHGPFLSADDLRNVSGIGEKRFQELKDKITVK